MNTENQPVVVSGCSTEANLDLMVANPADLAGGRPLPPANGEASALANQRYNEGKVPVLTRAGYDESAMNDQTPGRSAAGSTGKQSNRSGRAGCVAFINDPQSRAAVQAVCQPRQEKFTLHEGGSRDAAEYVARNTLPRILIIDISDSDQPMDALLPVLAAAGENTRVIAIGTANDVTLYRELIEAGVTDYLAKPLGDRAILGAIHRAEGADAAAKAPAGERSRIVVVMGSRGGVGASTAAANIAWFLAEERRRKTALLDLDLQFGTISLAFDVEPSRGLREAMMQPNRIDSLLVNSAAVRVTERLALLAAEEVA